MSLILGANPQNRHGSMCRPLYWWHDFSNKHVECPKGGRLLSISTQGSNLQHPQIHCEVLPDDETIISVRVFLP